MSTGLSLTWASIKYPSAFLASFRMEASSSVSSAAMPALSARRSASTLKLAAQNMILEGDRNPFFRRFHRRRIFRLIPEENHAQFPCFGIIIFQQAIGPDVPVKDKDLGIRVKFFDVKGIFDGALAADPGTIGIFFVSRSHTLNHDHLVQILGPFFFQPLGQFHLGHHPLDPRRTEIPWAVYSLAPVAKNHDPMVDFSFIHAGPHQNFGVKISFKSGKSDDQGMGQNLDF